MLHIPEYELEITTSRSSGAGGQHVNKTDTRITVRWNIKNSPTITEEQRERLLGKLHHRITADGEIVVHSSATRSQQQNKDIAIEALHQLINKALTIPKKRMKTRKPKGAIEARLREKSQRSELKKLRSSRYEP